MAPHRPSLAFAPCIPAGLRRDLILFLRSALTSDLPTLRGKGSFIPRIIGWCGRQNSLPLPAGSSRFRLSRSQATMSHTPIPISPRGQYLSIQDSSMPR